MRDRQGHTHCDYPGRALGAAPLDVVGEELYVPAEPALAAAARQSGAPAPSASQALAELAVAGLARGRLDNWAAAAGAADWAALNLTLDSQLALQGYHGSQWMVAARSETGPVGWACNVPAAQLQGSAARWVEPPLARGSSRPGVHTAGPEGVAGVLTSACVPTVSVKRVVNRRGLCLLSDLVGRH